MQTPLFLLTMGRNVSDVHPPHIEFDKLQWAETTALVEGKTGCLVGPFDRCPVLGERLSCIIHALRSEGREKNFMHNSVNGRRITQPAANKREKESTDMPKRSEIKSEMLISLPAGQFGSRKLREMCAAPRKSADPGSWVLCERTRAPLSGKILKLYWEVTSIKPTDHNTAL